MSKIDWLDDISQVVMHADDKEAALAVLAQQLPKKAQGAVSTLSQIMVGEVPPQKALKKSGSLWAALFQLAKRGDKPLPHYLGQYQHLAAARLSLESVFQTRFLAYLYFFWLIMTLFISLLIVTNKTLPTFTEFYQDFGVVLPLSTRFIIEGWFLFLAIATFLFAALFALIIPWWYRRRLNRLLPIPWYLRLFPFYMGVTRNYHRYLQLVFADIYANVGEPNPLQRGEAQLPKSFLAPHDQMLLNVALTHGGFNETLRLQQQKFATATLKHIRAADSLIGGIIFIIYAILVYTYIRGIYEPIFQLGEVVG